MDQGNFTFVSPSVEFKITNLTSVEEIAGLTFSGVVGEFPKGPAFEPFEIPNKDVSFRVIGAQNTEKLDGKVKFPAVYGINQFLEESNNVTAVRVLGLSGYNAGVGWAITVNGGVDEGNAIETDIASNASETILDGMFRGIAVPDIVGGSFAIDPEYVKSGDTYVGTRVEAQVVGFTGSTETHKIIYDEFDFVGDPEPNLATQQFTTVSTGNTATINNGVFNGAILPDTVGATVTSPTNFVYNGATGLYEDTIYEIEVVGFSGGTHEIVYDRIDVVAEPQLDVSTVVSNRVGDDVEETVFGGVFQGRTLPDTVGATTSIGSAYTFDGTQYTSKTYTVTILEWNPNGSIHEVVYSETGIVAPPLAEYEGRVVAVLRSRGRYNNENLEFDTETLQVSGGTGNQLYDRFTLLAVNSTTGRSENYTVSLNPTSRDYIVNVLGSKPSDGNSMVYVEKIYPATLTKYNNDNLAHSVKDSLVALTDSNFTDYSEQYRGAIAPWVVSELRGNKVERLFQVYTIGDGDASNSDVKISIQNINPDTKEFDLLVRDFTDTDNSPTILESYRRCSLNESLPSFIGKRIGSVDLGSGQYVYDRQSDYIYVVVNDQASSNAFPAGFEGYTVKSFASGDTGYSADAKEPQIFYKTQYEDNEIPARIYLGVSENAYVTSLTGSRSNAGINQDFFDYFGIETSNNVTKTKGFHMDSDVGGTTFYDGLVELGQFETGVASFKDVNDIIDPQNIYSDATTRKFTFVAKGGFDGWDIWRSRRSNSDLYAKGRSLYSQNNDWDAYARGIDLLGNTEEVEMNLMTTPNLNWLDNLTLVNRAIDLVERVRGDSLYIIDPPDIKGEGTASNLAELFTITGIDSKYVATYGPWLEFNDEQNARYIYLPPSQLVLKAFAITDNRAFAWFATAGLNRGRVDARRTRKKFSKPERDILYEARINPIADFKVGGVTIFGNKTTQVAENALDRINVIRLILTAQKTISNISRDLLFDPNDEIVRSQFETRTNAYLSRVKRERGLVDFKIVSDGFDPTVVDRNEMLYKLLIKPTRALEYIGIEFVVTPTGASFSDVTQTLG